MTASILHFPAHRVLRDQSITSELMEITRKKHPELSDAALRDLVDFVVELKAAGIGQSQGSRHDR